MSKHTYISRIVTVGSLFFLMPFYANAMHIAEGFLPPLHCGIWYILSIPFLIIGAKNLKKHIISDPQKKFLFAFAAAFVFLLSSLKLPSVAGSSSHLTGVALGALLFGGASMSITATIVLLFQALLLAHGGITTLGANIFSMGVVGTYLAIFTFWSANKVNIPKKTGVFLAAFISDIGIYCFTSVQLSVAFPDGNFWNSLTKFLSVFAVSQLPLAVLEGIITVIVFTILSKALTEKKGGFPHLLAD